MTIEPASRSAAWADACAHIIDTLDEPDLPRSLANALCTLVSFDECRQMVYAGAASPVIVFDSLQDHTYRTGLANYLNNSYLISPPYRMYRQGQFSGAYRLGDLAHLATREIDPKKYRISVLASEEIGYLTEGMPAGNEELCVGLDMRDGACAMISLTRKRSTKGFQPSEMDRIGTVVPVLAAAFRRYWLRARVPESVAAATLKRLSPREREIARLLVDGHSTLSISLRLDISVTTVKTHRKNIYAKLGISTQYELFSLYMKDLKTPRLHYHA